MPNFLDIAAGVVTITKDGYGAQTALNGGPGSLYYKAGTTVSSSSNDGTLTSGSSLSLTGPTSFVAVSQGARLVVSDPQYDEAASLAASVAQAGGVAGLDAGAFLAAGQAPPLPLSPAKTSWAKQERLAPPAAAAATVNIFTATGVGCVRQVWFAADAGTFGLDGRLQVFVDGEANPSIDIDLGTLFLFHNSAWSQTLGFTQRTPHWHGEAVPNGWFSGFLKLPIPYSNGITIRMMNPYGAATGNNNTYWQVIHQPGVTLPYRLKSFGASYAGGTATAACPTGAFNVQIADTPNLLNVTTTKPAWLAWFGTCQKGFGTGYTFLERNFQLTVDNESTPSIVSSGQEDFFFGSFYWQGRKQDSNGVGVATAATEADFSVNQGVDLLALCDGLRFESRMKVDLLTEAAVVDTHQMSWVSLYYQAV